MMFTTGPSYQFDAPLRQGEMRRCTYCGGAQLGPGSWSYAGATCRCWASDIVKTPTLTEWTRYGPGTGRLPHQRWEGVSAFRTDHRGLPIVRVKAGSAPA